MLKRILSIICYISFNICDQALIIYLDNIEDELQNKVINILNTNKITYKSLNLTKNNIIQYSYNSVENQQIPNEIKNIVTLIQESDFQIFLINSKSYVLNSNFMALFEWLENAYDKNILANKYNLILSFSQSHKYIDDNAFKSLTLLSLLNKAKSTNIKGYFSIVNSNNLPNKNFKILPGEEKEIAKYILLTNHIAQKENK